MNEEIKKEKNEILSKLKTQLITAIGVILTGVGTIFIDEVKSFIGVEGEESASKNEEVRGQNQEVNVSGPEIIINVPEQRKSETNTVVKEVPIRESKEKEEEIDW